MFILNKVGIDKVLHFMAGGWLAAFAPSKLWWVALLIAFVAGLSKEFIEVYVRKSKFDFLDLTATVLGGAVTAFFVWLGLMY